MKYYKRYKAWNQELDWFEISIMKIKVDLKYHQELLRDLISGQSIETTNAFYKAVVG